MAYVTMSDLADLADLSGSKGALMAVIQATTDAVKEAVASGDPWRLKCVIADWAKSGTIAMSTHATKEEIDKYFSRSDVVDFATKLWNSVKAGDDPQVATNPPPMQPPFPVTGQPVPGDVKPGSKCPPGPAPVPIQQPPPPPDPYNPYQAGPAYQQPAYAAQPYAAQPYPQPAYQPAAQPAYQQPFQQPLPPQSQGRAVRRRPQEEPAAPDRTMLIVAGIGGLGLLALVLAFALRGRSAPPIHYYPPAPRDDDPAPRGGAEVRVARNRGRRGRRGRR